VVEMRLGFSEKVGKSNIHMCENGRYAARVEFSGICLNVVGGRCT